MEPMKPLNYMLIIAEKYERYVEKQHGAKRLVINILTIPFAFLWTVTCIICATIGLILAIFEIIMTGVKE